MGIEGEGEGKEEEEKEEEKGGRGEREEKCIKEKKRVYSTVMSEQASAPG